MPISPSTNTKDVLVRGVDAELHRQLRKACIDKGIPASDVLREIINKGMASWLKRST